MFHIWLSFDFCMHVISPTLSDIELWLMSDMARSDISHVKFVYDYSCFEVQVEVLLYNKLYQRMYDTIFKKISKHNISGLGQRKSQDKF